MTNNTMCQFFHWFYPKEDHLWQHAANEAKHLSDLGITSVWLPPAYKASGGTYSMGYDIYDLYDLGEFDQKGSVATRFGTKQEYLQAIQSFHDNHIQVYADVVFNQKAGADEAEEVMAHKVNPDNRNEVISDDYKIKAYTKFTFPGRKDKYSSFHWDFQCFSGVDWDDNKKEKGVYKILNEYGKDWEEILGKEKGNFDYLMGADVEFRNKAVRDELKKWGLWYLETTGVDGFRLDAVKHISVLFFPEWLHDVRERSHKELFTVGENINSLDILRQYDEKTNRCMSLFDFPLRKRLRGASKGSPGYDLRTILDNTLVKADPVLSVTFIENHDTQPGKEDDEYIESWFLPHAYALILLRGEGYPCIFYPHLYDSFYKKKGEDGKEQKVQYEKCPSMETLLIARKLYAYGNQKDYFVQPNLIGWVREGTDENPSSGCAVLLSNNEDGQIEMEMGERHKGKAFKELTGSRQDKVTINEDGKATFFVNAKSIAVWVKED